MPEIVSCPGDRNGNSDGHFEHLLLKIEDVAQLAGFRVPENDEPKILPEGYLCTCGIVVGITNSGDAVSLCKLEVQ